jgi:F-type H+-transporting ATPase subunit b
MTASAEFWVGISFLMFIGIVLYYRVPRMIARALDERAEAIRKELDEARRVREQAQALLADYQRKHRGVDGEGEAIVTQAKREAEAYAQETRASLKEALERRTRLAEDKIARAESQAIDEVRAAAVEAAIAAAERILREKAAGASGAALIDQGIRDLKGRLN